MSAVCVGFSVFPQNTVSHAVAEIVGHLVSVVIFDRGERPNHANMCPMLCAEWLGFGRSRRKT